MDNRKKGTEDAQQATRGQRRHVRAGQVLKKTDRKEEANQAVCNEHFHAKVEEYSASQRKEADSWVIT